MRRPPPTDDQILSQPEPRDERMASLRGQQLLAELAARAEMERGDSPYYADERVVGWLSREVSSPHRSSDGWSPARIRSAATRLRARVEAARLKVRLVAGSPPVERAATPGMIADVLVHEVRRVAALHLGARRELGEELLAAERGQPFVARLGLRCGSVVGGASHDLILW